MFDQLPLTGQGRSVYPKVEFGGKETAKVLITVKAAPQPSATYGDTVCVAGIRMTDTGPEWIRLYPAPFRAMSDYEQFTKYELLEVEVQPAWKDPRSESYKPTWGSIKHQAFLKPWKPRHEFVSPLAGQWSMCSILKARKDEKPFPSLAAVEPADISRMEIYPFPGWSEKQQEYLQRDVGQEDLFGQVAKKMALQPPRFEAKFHYRCPETACNGHRQGFLDWELVALTRRLEQDDDAMAMDKIRGKFLDQLCEPAKRPLFFVGNQQKRQHIYSVLGIYPANSNH